MRKDAGFNIEDRITTCYQASGEMAQVLQTWSEYIKAETLSTELLAGEGDEGAYRETHQVDGETLELAVKRNG
jgi:hypothetical protein